MLMENFQISRPVGTGHSRPNDVIRLRKALHETGHGSSPPDPSGVYDTSLNNTIKRFQRDYGLEEDGIVTPDSPTARMIDIVLLAQRQGGDEGQAQLRQMVSAIGDAGLKPEAPPPGDNRPIVFTDANNRIATSGRVAGIISHSLKPSTDGRDRTASAPTAAAAATAAAATANEIAGGSDLVGPLVAIGPTALPIAAFLVGGAAMGGIGYAADKWGKAHPDYLARMQSERDTATGPIADRAARQRARHDANGAQRMIDASQGATLYPGGSAPPKLPIHTGSPQPPIPHDNEPETFPAEGPKLPTHTEFPIPKDRGMLIEIYPDQSGEISLPTIVENSRGDEPIQNLNTGIREVGDSVITEDNLSSQHVGGARGNDGKDKKETYLANAITGGRLGSARPDITFQSRKSLRRLFVNTTDTNAAGTAPTKREFGSAVRIVLNGESGDILVLIGKPPNGRSLDMQALKEFLRPLLNELDNPAPKIDPRDNTQPQDLWHKWFPGK